MASAVDRLFTEFAAQDVGAFAVCFIGGKHIKVAKWINGTDLWVATEEGLALLNPENAVESEPVDESTSKPKRKAKVPSPDLDDL